MDACGCYRDKHRGNIVVATDSDNIMGKYGCMCGCYRDNYCGNIVVETDSDNIMGKYGCMCGCYSDKNSDNIVWLIGTRIIVAMDRKQWLLWTGIMAAMVTSSSSSQALRRRDL